MTTRIDIYFEDLSEERQKEIRDKLHEDYDFSGAHLATLSFTEEPNYLVTESPVLQ